MNLALPAVIVILGLLPGIIFFHGYFASRFSKSIAGVGGLGEFALYVVFAMPLDAISVAIVSRFGVAPDFDLIARLMVTADAATLGGDLGRELQRHWLLIACTYSAVLIICYAIASLARRLVWASRFDVRIRLLRMRHEWYYVLLGRVEGMPDGCLPYADVMVEQAGETKLYQGMVHEFEPNGSGELGRLHLGDAHRGEGRSGAFEWKRIPGQVLVIAGPCIRSINMRYLGIESSEPASDAAVPWWQRGWRGIVKWTRRFLFEEP
ncbi:MAG: hypothetical protein HYV19_04335 [Gemmatimonadetes bacterium]|nr:hypothetical protein [Gemmatimonadota bacterium]